MEFKTDFLLEKILQGHKVSTDTRKILPGTIYFALKGGNFNGNHFAGEALKKGASFAVVDEKTETDPDRTILVDEVLVALQKVSTAYRRTLKSTIIAITGSNGKTTTKELLSRVLSQKYRTFATQGNLNNHIGVPLTLLSVQPDTEMVVLELGANHLKEIELLAEISEPDFGIITNVGLDHLEGYGSFENVARGHKELFDNLLKRGKNVFVNKQDQLVSELAQGFTKPIYYPADLEITENKFFIQLKTGSGNYINSQLPGIYNYPNIAVAYVAGKHFGIEELAVIQAIEGYQASNNRSQILKTERNTLLLDAYNANPSSMEVALENLSQMEVQNKVAILGDMFELGMYSDSEHKRMLEVASSKKFRFVFACGKEFYNHRSLFGQVYFYETRDELYNWLNENQISNCTVLLKASRGMALEKLTEVL